MASSHRHFFPCSSLPRPQHEERWVHQIQATLGDDEEDANVLPISVFSVPKPLLATKPEAYIPQLFALGPYHHWDSQLYDMESYKLATARRIQRQIRNHRLEDVVAHFMEHDRNIRSHYHRQLDLRKETVAWMMAIDASFLLEFLRNYSNAESSWDSAKAPSMSHMIDPAKMRLAYNSILRDIVMLENQIPLFLVQKILHFQSSSPGEQAAVDRELSEMLDRFVKEVSPFKVTTSTPLAKPTQHYSHLLQLLYCRMVDAAKPKLGTAEQQVIGILESAEIEQQGDGPELLADPSTLKKVVSSLWSAAAGLKVVSKVLVLKPVRVVMAIVKVAEPMEDLLSDEDSTENKPPLLEEIMIPSVTELTRAGVKFKQAKGGLETVRFDTKTATFYLPTVSLDTNTEVLLRNLVAYETSVESGPMVFTRYTELINGIIDTVEDVKLLRQSEIIKNRMKSDDEVAKLWNGMSKSVRLSKVGFVDKVIVDVNKYYSSRWNVKAKKFVTTYVIESWQLLTFFACILLLFLMCVQSFCSVYACRARWSGLFATKE